MSCAASRPGGRSEQLPATERRLAGGVFVVDNAPVSGPEKTDQNEQQRKSVPDGGLNDGFAAMGILILVIVLIVVVVRLV